MRLLVITAFLAFAVDQISKIWIVHVMDLKTRLAIDVLPPLLNFRMGWNRGINFGLFAGNEEWLRWILIAVAFGICAFVLRWVRKEGGGWRVYVSAGLLVGGAMGNVIDRIVYGAVADFLNMSCCGFTNPTAFNIADIAIFAGAIGLIFFVGKDSESQT